MSSVKKKKQRELRGRGEFNLFTTRADDGVLLGGDSVKEILCCCRRGRVSAFGKHNYVLSFIHCRGICIYIVF